MKYYLFAFLLWTAACAPSSTKVWLGEYELLLKETVSVLLEKPGSPEAETMRLKLSQKEAQINDLLKTVTTQEQMSFLSEYYDMRVKFFYQLKE